MSALYAGEAQSGSKYYEAEDEGFCRRRENNCSCAFGRFHGKVAVVTGAAGNFGEACALRLAAEGASVALVDLRSSDDVRLKLVSEKPEQKFSSHVVDVRDWQAVRRVFEDIVKFHGRVNYLANNAGYQGNFEGAESYDPEDFKKVMDINVNGMFYCLQAAAQVMKEDGGAIVQTASMAGISAPPCMVAYASSKAAVLHMTKACAKDLSKFNIRVNSVSPAFIGPGDLWTRQIEKQANASSIYYDTDPDIVKKQMIESTPMRRYGSIDEVIGPILFLFSDDASYLTGVDIQITGGIN